MKISFAKQKYGVAGDGGACVARVARSLTRPLLPAPKAMLKAKPQWPKNEIKKGKSSVNKAKRRLYISYNYRQL